MMALCGSMARQYRLAMQIALSALHRYASSLILAVSRLEALLCNRGNMQAWQGRAGLRADLKESFFTVLQAGLHVVKGSAARVGSVCVCVRIVNVTLHYDAMRQQQLPDVRPTCNSHSKLDKTAKEQ